MNLLHASAVLAWLQQEPGWRQINLDGSNITALDYAAVLDQAERLGLNSTAVARQFTALGLKVVSVRLLDAERAAKLPRNQSLADRIDLAVAERLNAQLVTADAIYTQESG